MAMTEIEKMQEKIAEIDPLSEKTAMMVGRLDKVYSDLSGQISDVQKKMETMATKDDIAAILTAINQLTDSIEALRHDQAAVEITAHRAAADVAALKLAR